MKTITCGNLLFDSTSGELILPKQYPKSWSKADIKWSQDLEEISEAAKSHGVCTFLSVVERLKLPINKYVNRDMGSIITHEVNGWYFNFKYGAGDLISIV